MSQSIRIGAVNYLNTKPLIYDLERLAPKALLSLDLPSGLADRLAASELDVALIPVIEYFRGANYSFGLVPSGQGVVSVSVPAGSAVNGGGTGNTASNVLSWTFDSVAPTVWVE